MDRLISANSSEAERQSEEEFKIEIDALINRGFPEPMLRALLTAFASTSAIAIDLTSLAQSASLYADERGKWSGDRSGGATSLVTAPSTLPLPPHQTLIELLAVACNVALKMPVRVVRCTPQTRPRDLFYSNLQQKQSQADNVSSTSFDSMIRLASNLQPSAGRDAEEFLRLVQSHFAARDGLLASLVSEELDFINSNQVGDGVGNAGDAPSASPPPFLRFKSQVAAAVSPANRVGLAHRRMESDSFTPSSSRFTSVGLHRGDVGNISSDQQQQQLDTPFFYRDASQRVAMPMGPPLALALTRSQRSDASQRQPAQTHPRGMLDSFANHSVGPAAMSMLMKQISLAKKPTSPAGSPRACAPVALGGGLPRPPSAALGASSASPSSDNLGASSLPWSPQGERRDFEGQFSHENINLDHHQCRVDEPSPPPPRNEDEHEAAAAVSSLSPSDAVQSPSRGKMFHFGSAETAAPASLQTPLSRNASMAGNAALLAGSAVPSATVAAHRASMNVASPPPMQQPASSLQRWNRASDATNASVPLPSAVDQLDGPLFANVCIFEDFHLAPAAIQTIILEAIRIKQVTVSGKIVKLDSSRLFICTHRAQSDDYIPAPLSRAILDSFALELQPGPALLIDLFYFLCSLDLVAQPNRLVDFLPWFRQRVEQMPVRHTMAQYMRDIIVALRQLPEVALGPAPSAGAALTRAACAHAAMLGVWDLLRPADVDGVCVDALCARLTLRVPDAAGHDVARLLIAHAVFRLMKPPK